MFKQMTDRVYYLENQLKTDRPYIFYVKGDKKNLVIEAGESANHLAYVYNEMEKSGLKVPDYTVVTHWHWDHTFGMHAVKGITIASPETNVKLREMQEWEWSKEAIEQRLRDDTDLLFGAFCMNQEYSYFDDIIIKESDIEVKDDMVIDLGGVTCHIMNHDSTHSRGALFVHIPEENLLAIGDADYEDYYDNDGYYDQEKLHNLIEFFSGINVDFFLRSHEGKMPKEVVMEYLNSKIGINEPGPATNVAFKQYLIEEMGVADSGFDY